jgi:hypothetical protein
MRWNARFGRVIVGALILALTREARAQETQPSAEELRKALQEIQQLKQQLKEVKDQLKFLPETEVFKSLQPESKAPPTTNGPDVFSPSAPGAISDVGCRGRLSGKTNPSDPANKLVGLTDDKHCGQLYPITRLAFENLSLGVTGGYTNLAASPNLGANLPIVRNSTTTYRVGIGWSGKPIVRQLRSVWLNEDPNSVSLAVMRQGSAWEDFAINPWVLNAAVGYGKTSVLKNEDRIRAGGSRPSYSATLSYVLDLERVWVHLAHGEGAARPVDPGYYFAPGNEDWWEGRGFKTGP